MKIISLDLAVLGENSTICIIGQCEFSEAIKYCLAELNICDITVIPIKRILEHPDTIATAELNKKILIVGDYINTNLCSILENAGICTMYRADKILDEVDLVRISAHKNIPPLAVKGYRRRFLYYHNQSKCDSDMVELVSLDLMITERCTLRCKNCSNLMQYYAHPENLNLNQAMESLERLVKLTDNIWELRLIGGEPFANPDFVPMIPRIASLRKVRAIIINSNATVNPDKIMTQYLKEKKLVMRFSDYGSLSRNLDKWKDFCIKNDILYEIIKDDKWQDLGDFKKKYRSETEKEYIFGRCHCKELPTLLKGRLYGCPVSANAANLGIMTESEKMSDSLDFSFEGVRTDRKQLAEFLLSRKYMQACDYCGGRNIYDAWCKPHVQIARPLPIPMEGRKNA